MFKIVGKDLLAPNIYKILVEAPLVAARARPGNFVIIRVHNAGERVPITVSNHDSEAGTLTLVIQAVGKSTKDMADLEVGDAIRDILGPLGVPTKIEKARRIIGVCGGIGVAPMLPLLRAYRRQGTEIVTIQGARSGELLILQDEVKTVSDEVILVTDDGSIGGKGLVTNPLLELLGQGAQFDHALAIGPAGMMQAVCQVTRDYDLPTTVSLNAIMIDGTGMCGGCRVTVGGETKFTCVDGPAFDGHAVDFEELILRQAYYREEEEYARECRRCGEEG
ncbi:MAG: sulfide/dihydroorotate dehydrogenase-like FAD/NAD-binding protein [Firmicutes bacterium]|nr:sulfide/dihydroorotate dehydrogenase-like FAD/NAD-binding protein [Bacillota bacterium]